MAFGFGEGLGGGNSRKVSSDHRGASQEGGFIRVSGHRDCEGVGQVVRLRSSGSSKRDRLRVTERNPPIPDPGGALVNTA